MAVAFAPLFGLTFALGQFKNRPIAIAAGVTLVASLLFLLVGLRSAARGGKGTHAWADLMSRAGHWRFRPDPEGGVIREPHPTNTLKHEDQGSSLVLAPAGDAVATLSGDRLRIFTVDPSDATVSPWGTPIEAPARDARVLAVARRGDWGMWCALATPDRTYWTSVRKSQPEPEWRELHDTKAASHAAIVHAELVFLENGRLFKAGSRRDKEPWHPMGLPALREHERVIAFDVARIRDAIFIALVVQDLDDERVVSARTVVVALDDPDRAASRGLKPKCTNLAIVRSRVQQTTSPLVLLAEAARITTYHPFDLPLPGSGARGKRQRRVAADAALNPPVRASVDE